MFFLVTSLYILAPSIKYSHFSYNLIGRRRSSALSGRMGGVDDLISQVTFSGAIIFLVVALIIALGLYLYHGSSDMPS